MGRQLGGGELLKAPPAHLAGEGALRPNTLVGVLGAKELCVQEEVKLKRWNRQLEQVCETYLDLFELVVDDVIGCGKPE